MRRKQNISKRTTIILNNDKNIYTTKHINNANNSPLIEKKFKNNTTKTNKQNKQEK